MSYMDIGSHYKLNFSLHRHHHYSMTEIENFMPFERDLYVDLIMDAIKEEKEAQAQSRQ